MPTSVSPSLSRREFLRRSTQIAAPLIVAPSVLGRAGAVAPNSRIQLACIGTGGQGTSNLRAFLTDERVQVVGIADVDDEHRAAAAKLAGLSSGQTTRDFREIISRSDVDVIMNATPDHWHSNVVIAAAKAGKDLYWKSHWRPASPRGVPCVLRWRSTRGFSSAALGDVQG